MTEIEQAIEVLTTGRWSCQQSGTLGSFPKMDPFTAIDIAVSALRREQERSKGCSWCLDPDCLEAYREQGDKFCRHCGRPLIEAESGDGI